jgi:hypothetical protein
MIHLNDCPSVKSVRCERSHHPAGWFIRPVERRHEFDGYALGTRVAGCLVERQQRAPEQGALAVDRKHHGHIEGVAFRKNASPRMDLPYARPRGGH